MTTSLGKIGFAGIGAMGTPMSINLIKAGHKLVLFDIDRKKAEAVAATHECEVATSLTDMASKSDTVITMLPDGKLVHKAIVGAGGICETLKPGSLIIDMSSSSPMGTRELGALLAKKGFQFIDAPVSNGVKGATAATLSIMVGGDKAIFERVKPLLEKMGNQIYYAGPLGAGHAIKALNNYVSAAGMIAACEAMHAGEAFGIDPNVAIDIINTSSGYNGTTQRKCKQFMISGTYNAGFSTGLMAKDVRTALDIAQAMGTSTILAEPTADIWDAMEQKLGFLSDHTEMHKFTNKNK
jgi:3-hydroxyisobutyrate dehydrogenase